MVESDNQHLRSVHNSQSDVIDVIERMLHAATRRQPRGDIMEVLRRIVEGAIAYYSASHRTPVSTREGERLVLGLWDVLTSNNIDDPLNVEEGLLPGVSRCTSRSEFVEQFAVEFVVLTPVPGVTPGSKERGDSLLPAQQHRFEEFLVAIVLFHLIQECGAWLSMSVVTTTLFEFLDAMSIADQEPVCRELLRAMAAVDECRYKKNVTPPGPAQV